jgi:hypothetical protein
MARGVVHCTEQILSSEKAKVGVHAFGQMNFKEDPSTLMESFTSLR